MPYAIRSRDHHFKSLGPKRILTLDGGGLRGVLSLGYLQCIKELLGSRHDGADSFRLAHYFDLIAGTSTGAIIAAALAKGLTVAAITEHYLRMGREVFDDKSWFSKVLRDKYDKKKLDKLLQSVLGETTTLGSDDLLTGLLVVTKRCDTGSPWPLGNNPEGEYYRAPQGARWRSNAHYPLWQVIRASTAAPTFFQPEPIAIDGEQLGRFVDGGVSPHNNPSLQAFMYATLGGYGVNWPTGEEKLLVVSVGTGAGQPAVDDSSVSALQGVYALGGLMTDSAALVETMMQWMSNSYDTGRLHSMPNAAHERTQRLVSVRRASTDRDAERIRAPCDKPAYSDSCGSSLSTPSTALSSSAYSSPRNSNRDRRLNVACEPSL